MWALSHRSRSVAPKLHPGPLTLVRATRPTEGAHALRTAIVISNDSGRRDPFPPPPPSSKNLKHRHLKWKGVSYSGFGDGG